MAAQPPPRLTPEQYLALERAAVEQRHEYFEGAMYAMSGGSYSHAAIIGNLSRRLGNALDQRGCMVLNSDLRVRVSPGGLYAYPDVLVVCGGPQFADDRDDTITNPAVILEVLSPSTEAYDRGFKFHQYRTLPSLEEYAVVAQSEARVEIFRRQASGDWLLSEAVGLESTCRFERLQIAVALNEIYSNVTFEPEPTR